MSAQQHRAAWSWLAVAALVVFAAACGSSRKDSGSSGGGGGGGGGGGWTGTGENVATGAFKVVIQSVDVPQGGGQPVVTFRVTQNDAAVDNLIDLVKNGPPQGSTTPGSFPWVSPPRFTLSARQASGDYQSYYTVDATGAAYNIPDENDPTKTTPGTIAITTPVKQATFQQPTQADPAGTGLQFTSNGTYKFTFPALPGGTTVDRAATHTAGIWMTRTASQGAEGESATSTFNFVPNGGTPNGIQTVTTEGCNRCHAPAVSAHDERLGTQVCLTCHSPQTTDPDTGNTVDFKVMIHKIHYGGDLPSAQGATGQPYRIVGFRQGVSTFGDSWMNDVRNCTVCHQGVNADNWKNNANLVACTACHDNVKFGDQPSPPATECSLGKLDTDPCKHPNAVTSTQDCKTCHSGTGSVAPATVHVPLSEQAKAFKYEIQKVDVDATTRVPTVTFAVRKPDNSAYDLATDPAYTDPGASLTAIFAWPTQEFTNEGSGQKGSQPVRVAIVSAGKLAQTSGVNNATPTGAAGVYTVTGPPLPAATDTPFTSATLLGGASNAVPSGQVHLEGHPIVHGFEMPVQNVQATYALSGQTAPARRQVVDVAKCNQCHGYLSAHGGNRNDVPAVCVACHNPRATDVARSSVAPVDPKPPEQSIDFKVLIHAIHSGDIRHDPFVVWGFGPSRVEFPGEIPHGVGNCNICHANDSYDVPAGSATIPLNTWFNTNNTAIFADDTGEVFKVRAVCASCHDQVKFDAGSSSLPACNSLATPNSAPCFHSGDVQATDSSCAGCHKKGSSIAGVDKVHPIQ